MFDLTGKFAIVTGGASGIGYAIADRFIRAGARVAIFDIAPNVVAIAGKLGAIGRRVDVSDGDAMAEALDDVASDGLDVMVNNAAIQPLGPTLDETTPELLRQTYAVNVESILHTLRLCPPLMRPGGRILNMASYVGSMPAPKVSAYGLSKASVIYLTKVAAIELAPRRINVNCVSPGTIRTPVVEAIPDNPEIKWVEKTCPLHRLGEPEEVAAAFHYLASDEAAYMTGHCLVIDGGTTAALLEHDVIPPAQVVAGRWQPG